MAITGLEYGARMRSLPDPGFAGDIGTAPPALAEALAGFADGGRNAVLAALSAGERRARLLVPVVADAVGDASADHEGDVSTVLMRGADGRLALLAFTSLGALTSWQGDARPVPVTAQAAAEAALAERAAALVIDVAGPVLFVVETAELAEIAAGHRLLPTAHGYGWFASWSHAAR